jgi:hypothetical protein
MCGADGNYGERREMPTKFLSENLKEKDHFGDRGMYERI